MGSLVCCKTLSLRGLLSFYQHIAKRDETVQLIVVQALVTSDTNRRNNRLTLQANTVRADDKETPPVTRLVLLEHFTFLLRQRETLSVIMLGNVFPKSA